VLAGSAGVDTRRGARCIVDRVMTHGHVSRTGALAVLWLLACRTPEPSAGVAPTPTIRTADASPPAASGETAAAPTSVGPAVVDEPVAASPPVTSDAPGGAVGEAEPPPDLLTFARGAIPLRVAGRGGKGAAGIDEALQAIDGVRTPYSMDRQAPADTFTEIFLELPAPTTFSRFTVPRVGEVPSKFTTFTRDVEVHGSATSASDGYVLLASATLATHASDDEVSELAIRDTRPVRWVKLRLAGGIAIEAEQSTIQFSEIIGAGTQEPARLLERFGGTWRARGANFDLRQEGALVSGCYDDISELDGTVTGNLLRARGVASGTGVVSLFVLTVMPDGELRGVRSTNGAPFRLVTSVTAAAGAPVQCPRLAPPKLGCGSVIHGIQFAFDSAEIRADSGPILDRLHAGLVGGGGKVVVEGHTSSEGKASYNRDLSRRRAEAVVADLVRRGIPRERLTAAGRGPDAPIAGNDDEAGRSINRRVEIRCP